MLGVDMNAHARCRGIVQEERRGSVQGKAAAFRQQHRIFGALAEFERDLIRERTRAGLTAARARGRKGGRPKAAAFRDPKKLALARKLYAEQQTPVATICQMLKVSRATFYRYLATHPTDDAATPRVLEAEG